MAHPDLRCAHLADAADTLNLSIGAGGQSLRYFAPPQAVVSGRARTLRQAVPEAGRSALPLRHGEFSSGMIAAGDIVVIQVEGESFAGTWGEAHSMRAKARGAAGVLIDGYSRDVELLGALGPAVSCRGGTPLRSAGRLETREIGGTVEIEGQPITEGDFVMIDSDGFVVIPAQYADRILEQAHVILAAEEARNLEIRAGNLGATALCTLVFR